MIPAAHVIFILDDSGSMKFSRGITKKAFDGMVESLQLCKGADIVMSLIKYGTHPVLVYGRKHIQDVEPVSYNPESEHDTIYDSMLFAINLAKKAPREEKTIIILQADGGDTCSKATPSKVGEAVAHAKAAGMEFLYLGNTTSGVEYHILEMGKRMGFLESEILFYGSGSEKESLVAFSETATNIGSVASRLTEHAAYTKEQQERVKG